MVSRHLVTATSDIREALQKYQLAGLFGWQDVAQRYRRSRIGAFWLTINMGVLIASIGLVFGALFQAPVEAYLPHLCAGLIVWSLIATAISEGCTTFISSQGIILQVRMPFFTHIMRMMWRNIIIFLHNLIIIPIILVIFRIVPFDKWLYVPIGVALLVVNLLWISLLLAIVCTRYRDLTQIIQNTLQIFFYATPIMWMPSSLPQGIAHNLLVFNPFFHLISIVRNPLLGLPTSSVSWMVSISAALIGWVLTLLFFNHYRRRIPYWL